MVAYERWSHLEVQLHLGCSYLFFTETLFALFFSTVWIKCYFRPQGLVFFVMKDSRVTFKGKTSPGGRSIKGRGGVEEKKAKERRNRIWEPFPLSPVPLLLLGDFPCGVVSGTVLRSTDSGSEESERFHFLPT